MTLAHATSLDIAWAASGEQITIDKSVVWSKLPLANLLYG